MSRLIIENLEKVYKGAVETIAVRDFNLNANNGDIITLAGPSGSGKTTILLCVAGILEPTFGKIIYDNHVINNLPEEELTLYRRNNVGIIFQSFNLIDYFTIYENIAFPLWLANKSKKLIKKRVTTLLQELDIERYANTYPRFLSGGELIALGLAFRLALTMYMIRGKIPLLILDEPTPFLDEERRRKLVEITSNYLRKIPQVIIVSHDDELKDAADRVINVELMGGSSRVSYVEA